MPFSTYAGRSSYTIVDSGGYDTLNLSNFSANQVIHLDPTLPGSTTASVSNVGGGIGNLSLAVGTIIEAAIGGSGNDRILGNDTDNALRGGPGKDTMDGGQGSDLYLIKNGGEHPVAEINDTGTMGVDELRFDAVTPGDTLTLFAADRGLERVTIGTGSSALAVLSDTTTLNINAAAAPNALAIQGNSGINAMIGSAFIDTLDGGEGSDIYIITDNAQHSAAEISDTGINGMDELRFAVTTAGQTLTIFAGDLGLERVRIGTGLAVTAITTATTPLHLDASAAANALLISGNAGSNAIIGSAFTDTLDGGEGSDIYLITNAFQHSAPEVNDSGLSGSDELRFAATNPGQTLTVFSADRGLERISIGTGHATNPDSSASTALNIDASLAPNALAISGNAGANRLTGSAFNDSLNGGEGLDTLTGGLGADSFTFDTPLNLITSPDQFVDFSPHQGDVINLDSKVFFVFGKIGPLDPAAFHVGESFTSELEQILYNPLSGFLSYNNSDLTTFAVLPSGLESQISALSFQVI